MHAIEPYYNWRNLYIGEEDEYSPFYGRNYSEFYFSNTIYNYYIHPQWDEFGSETLYIKVIYADYMQGFGIMELIGEWNDAVNNDIMFLKRDVIDLFAKQNINKWILIGENVLNFHGSDDCYYEEWFQDAEEGWIVGLNFRDYVLKEFSKFNIDYYIGFGGEFDAYNWRTLLPKQLYTQIEKIISKRLA